MKKKIILVVSVILLIVLALFVRKYIILKDITNKWKKYASSNNYHMTYYMYQNDMYNFEDYFYKDGNGLLKENRIYYDSEEKSMIKEESILVTKNNNTVLYYTNKDEEKVFQNWSPYDAEPLRYGNYDKLSFKEFLIATLNCKITTDNVNGKECYKIETKDRDLYVDKETGLRIREDSDIVTQTLSEDHTEYIEDRDNQIINYFYEFGQVTEEDLVEPDISEYRLVENT